jgi:hypothetical protein
VSDVVVRLPPVDELALRWHQIEPFLRRATERTQCYEPIDLLYLTMQGQVAIWLVEISGSVAAAISTEMHQYPRRRVLEVTFGGGDGMAHWIKPLVAAIDEYARQLKCTHVACLGRPGWARAWGAELTGDVMLVRGIWDVERE